MRLRKMIRKLLKKGYEVSCPVLNVGTGVTIKPTRTAVAIVEEDDGATQELSRKKAIKLFMQIQREGKKPVDKTESAAAKVSTKAKKKKK